MAYDWAIKTKDFIDINNPSQNILSGDIFINSNGDVGLVGDYDGDDDLDLVVGMDLLYYVLNNKIELFELLEQGEPLAIKTIKEQFRDDDRITQLDVGFNGNVLLLTYTVNTGYSSLLEFDLLQEA